MFISCIMPTGGRLQFVSLAVRFFQRQCHRQRELIIIDDGTPGIERVLPEDDRIRRIVVPPGLSLGEKRNIACAQARGELIVHWDDDDWHAPQQLTLQVAPFSDPTVEVSGLQSLLFFDPVAGAAWRYRFTHRNIPWLAGSTLSYRRSTWRRSPFAPISVGEDARFVAALRIPVVHVLEGADFHVGLIHATNISPKRPRPPHWQPIAVGPVLATMGEDAEELRVACVAQSALNRGQRPISPRPE